MQWFRWYRGTCTDPKLGSIARKTGEPRERVIAVWAMILESASESTDRGRHTLDADGIADALNCPSEPIRAILSDMTDRGMVDAEGRVTRWGERQFASDDSAPRVRDLRAKRNKKDDDCNGDVTLHGRYGNGGVTPPDTDTDTEKKEREAKASRADAVASGDARSANGRAGEGGNPSTPAAEQGTPEADPPPAKSKLRGKKPTPKAKKGEGDKAQRDEFLAYFRRQWERQYGEPAAVAFGKDDVHARFILKQPSVKGDVAKAKAKVDAYLRDSTRFIADAHHSLGMLVSQFSRYIGTPGGNVSATDDLPDLSDPDVASRVLREAHRHEHDDDDEQAA